ncbi:MAG: MBL fold metallo-hydrolase, partial [Gammaproteobacteria bacterium]|nr:MBL fold metallo-hydrolase [Gammaproteobacteria bacterium]
QKTFGQLFNLGRDFALDGSQFDKLIDDGETLMCGDIALSAFATPGHTSDSISLQAGDAIFIGDTLFSPQYGTARCDFPGGSAVDLYRSVSRLMKEPDETRLYLCHDYPVAGEQPVAFSTVKQQKKNIHVGEGVSEAEFIALRKQRDAELDLPRLLLPAIQVNIRAGNWPDPEDNGTRYLKIPINKM